MLAINFVCEQAAHLGNRFDLERYSNPFWYSRANFDGFYYLSIARGGYGQLQEAFFPLYPRLIRLLTRPTGDFLVSGLLISGLSLMGAVYFLGKLMLISGEKESVARKTILALLFFPTSFYFLSVYTESFFLFLAVLTFWFAKKNRWLEAGLISGLAAYTRAIGIFLVPALLFEYWSQRSLKGRKKFQNSLISSIKKPGVFWRYLKEIERKLYHFKNTFYIFLGSWGLIAYGLELLRKKGDFFYLIHVQPGLGGVRPLDKFVLPYQVVWRYLKMFVLVEKNILRYYTVWFEFLVAGSIAVLLILGLTKRYRVPKSMLIYGWLVFILPTLTGTLLSIPRFVLVIFPAFWVLGKILDKFHKLTVVYYSISVILLAIAIIFFARGYWIS